MGKWLAALREKSGISGGTEPLKGSKDCSEGFEPFEGSPSGGRSENSPSVPAAPHTENWDNRTTFMALLRKVGAKTFLEDGKPLLRFDPPLESPEADPDRWAMAEDLEALFWQLCEEHGY